MPLTPDGPGQAADAQPPLRALEAKVPAPVVAALVGAAMKLYAMNFGIAIDPTPLRMVVGLGFAQASGLLALAALLTMRLARTTINPLTPGRATQLVTGGVFRFSRNPVYLSLLWLVIAYAIRLDSAAVWLGPVLFVLYVSRFQIQPEERALHAKFGEAYLAYQRRTRRWL